MKKSEIKKILNEAFESVTPSYSSKIKEECNKKIQITPNETDNIITNINNNNNKTFVFSKMLKSLAFVLIISIFFTTGFLIGNIKPKETETIKDASIYLDVNPSIEIQIDENQKVIKCIPTNIDAEKILNNITLDGVDINTALFAIVGSMYTNGYLNSENNSILVTVDTKSEQSNLLSQITTQIENVFKENENMNCSIIAQKVDSTNELIDLSKQYKISIGKMYLIEKIISSGNLYTSENIEELSKMSIHELTFIYQTLNSTQNENEIISGIVGGYIDYMEALNKILSFLMISEEDLEKYNVVTLYHHDQNEENKMVYLLTISFKQVQMKFVIDCESGEIMPEETIDEWKDKLLSDSFWGNIFN